MKPILNCDMGEGIGNDEQLMPFIGAANIACGWHAGNENTIAQTISLCLQYDVEIGAHPSFADRKHFGRKEIHLPPHELYELITQQLIILHEFAAAVGATLRHIKPHGALYNLSAKDPLTATVIAKAVKDFDSSLVLFGLSGSCSITEAEKNGLKTAAEVFADRTYQDDGSLTPRSVPGSLIEDADKAVQQVLEIIKKGIVTSVSGKTIPIRADTICIHGDGKHAAEFAKSIHTVLKQIS